MEWQKVKLGKVCPAIRGSVITKRDLIDGNIPVIAGGLEPAYYHGISNRIPPTITVAGSGANAGFVRWWNEPIFASDCSTLSSDNDYDLRYIYYFLKSEQEHIYSSQTGAAQPHIYPQHINDLSIFLPPLPTQRKIAEVLGALDDKIELSRQQNKTLEHLAQTLFKHHFIDNPEAKEWKRGVLGDMITPVRGKNITRDKMVEGSVPVASAGLEPSGYHSLANTHFPVVTISSSGANAGFVRLWGENIWAADCSYIDSKMTSDIYFYYILLKLNQDRIFGMQTGSGQPHVYPSHLASIVLQIPPPPLLQQFQSEVSPLFEQIRTNSEQSQTLTTLRQTLLPRLISGELDVSNVEVSA